MKQHANHVVYSMDSRKQSEFSIKIRIMGIFTALLVLCGVNLMDLADITPLNVKLNGV